MNASASVSLHTVVSDEAWLAARRDLLKQEKQLTKQQQRMGWTTPWVSSHRDDFSYDFAEQSTPRVSSRSREETLVQT